MKSPFFRSWFGDWRAHDTSKAEVAEIPAYTATNEARAKNRGTVQNADTGWDIRISREGETNTISHSGEARMSEYGLSGIRGLIENAVLLDTEVHEHHSNNAKNDRIAFDHKLYALGKSTDGDVGLYRITVEEAFANPLNPHDKRFHNLKYIEKVADSIGSLTHGSKAHGAESTSDVSTTTYSVSDLYGFVKTYDKEFSAGKEISPQLLNSDGTPKVVYHATDAEFTVFDRVRLGESTSLNTSWEPAIRSAKIGFWFSDRDLTEDMASSPERLKAVYLVIRKPYRTKTESIFKAMERMTPEAYVRRLKKEGYDGLIVKDSEFNSESYVVFDNTQIKSATDNIGTFDPNNPDIRYSVSDGNASSNMDASEAASRLTYDELVSKPDMHLAQMTVPSYYGDSEPPARADVVRAAIESARAKGNTRNTAENVFVRNLDTGNDIMISKTGIDHGLRRKYELNAVASANIGALVENAILINRHSARTGGVEGNVYLSAGMYGEDLYLCRIITNEHGEVDDLEVMYALNAKRNRSRITAAV